MDELENARMLARPEQGQDSFVEESVSRLDAVVHAPHMEHVNVLETEK